MNENFHKPFIKSLIIASVVTVFAMVSSKFVIEYYMNHSLYPHKTIEYSSQQQFNESNTGSK